MTTNPAIGTGAVIPTSYTDEANAAYAQANVALNVAQSAFAQANSGGSGGSGANVSVSVNQTAHGFFVGNVITFSNSVYALANAANSSTLGIGIVSVVPNANYFTFVEAGTIYGLSGLVSNQYYYTSINAAGQLTTVEPTTGFSNPLLLSITSNNAIVLPYRPSAANFAFSQDNTIANLAFNRANSSFSNVRVSSNDSNFTWTQAGSLGVVSTGSSSNSINLIAGNGTSLYVDTTNNAIRINSVLPGTNLSFSNTPTNISGTTFYYNLATAWTFTNKQSIQITGVLYHSNVSNSIGFGFHRPASNCGYYLASQPDGNFVLYRYANGVSTSLGATGGGVIPAVKSYQNIKLSISIDAGNSQFFTAAISNYSFQKIFNDTTFDLTSGTWTIGAQASQFSDIGNTRYYIEP